MLVLSLLFASGYREKLSVILKAKLHWLAVFCYAGRCYVLVRSKLFLLLRGWQICFFKSISWNRLSSKGCVPSSDCVGQARGGMAKEVPVEYRRICFSKKEYRRIQRTPIIVQVNASLNFHNMLPYFEGFLVPSELLGCIPKDKYAL